MMGLRTRREIERDAWLRGLQAGQRIAAGAGGNAGAGDPDGTKAQDRKRRIEASGLRSIQGGRS
jgi:hypothetical protein